ncbi:centromere protein F isoform X2 [Ranitomeya variabilis]|uniref:centromere protein F isoform X2 n=1 Tax=Ranitomeya variabilis TaxID=490064 RepID=UPI004057C26D
MSWVVEEWKEGLPTRSLQKIQELESQLDKLKKERQQRQLQLESLEAAFQKQKQKVESEKSEVVALKRENQSLIELCDNQEKTRQKLSHEQQVKEAQVSLLEGQLSAGKKQLENLEQELKRYKNDLERNQQSFNAADMSVCVTPQKSFSVSFTPVKLNDSKYEELQEKYQKEVEERKKLEAELKLLQIKLMNQPSQPPAPSTMNHRDIARHQSSSSVFSWQQERTPSRVSSGSHDASGLKRNYTAIQYPWEQEETPSKRGFKSDGGNHRSFCESANNPANDQLRNQNQELRSKVNDLELRFQVQEKELKNQLHKLQAALSDRDKTLAKCRDDLARMTGQYEQSVDKCSSTEQKLKKVSEELVCQRQNAESARVTLEQKLKEQEKENQQELFRRQNSLHNVEQELEQMRIRLSQEAQQAKNQCNALQAQLDRAMHGKKMLEHEVEDVKQKLSRAEQAASASQNHLTDLKKELEESRSQQNAIKSQLDHKARENSKLEDEFRTATQTLRQNQVFIEELKNKNNTLDAEIKSAVEKRNCQDSTSIDNLKATMTNLEKERDSAKELLQKRENEISGINSVHAQTSEELSTLKNLLHCKEEECKDWIHCKTEYESNTRKFFTEKEEMSRKIEDMESTVQRQTGQITVLENDKKHLHTQIKTLQDITDVRTADLEVQKVNCANLNSHMESEIQKYQKEIEKLLQKLSELEMERKTDELDVWSKRVSFLEKELETQKKINAELQSQHDLRNLQEIQKHMSDPEGKGKGRLSNSTNDILLEPCVDSFTSIVKEKEEEIITLSEKISFAKAEIETVCQSNRELTTRLQELTVLSESWSSERETLGGSIVSLQKDVEKLTEENRRMAELLNVPKCENMHLDNALMDTLERGIIGEDNLVNWSTDENARQDVSLKGEVVEWKEKVFRFQQENSHLLRANEELTTLIGKLRENEFSLNKTLEELRHCLKDKETSLINSQSKLELLSRNKEEDLPVESVKERLLDLQNDSDLKKFLQEHAKCPKQKGKVLHNLDETTLIGSSNGMVMDYSVLDITEDISSFPLSIGPQSHEENLTLLFNMDQLSLASTNNATMALADLVQLESQNSATLSPLTSPPVKQMVDEHGGRKSTTNEIVDLSLVRSPQQQQVSGVRSDASPEIKDLSMVYQKELNRLQKQHLSEIATWQQKLKDQASEMEARLSSEKAEVEQLTKELESARLELQIFDLSANSLPLLDSEDVTVNQTMCTVLPIGRLSIGNTELRTHGQLKRSPKVENKSEDEKVIEMGNSESPTNKEENIENSSRERKRRNGGSGVHVGNLETQDMSRSLQLKTEEEQKLCPQCTEREEIYQNLVAEIKYLSAQVETLRAEILKKDQEIQDLDNKSKDFGVERSELLGKIELISYEKLQSANKIVEFEKELNNSLNAIEILNSKVSELSSVCENLEISGKEWKENYLQTEIELRRVKSEKANIENHALSLEADLDALQSKWQRLQEESESKLRSFNEVQENLNNVVAEKCQLTQELESLFEEKEELEQMYKKLQVREQELESVRLSSKDLIKILESELRSLKEELQVAKLTAEELTAEKDCLMCSQENEKKQVQELQNWIQKFEEEKKVLASEQENLQVQVSTVQAENEKLSRTLERCQREKLELGNSVNSAQEEVTQMRAGIEKLKVKIEADEKKKRHWMEKLKESERKFDKLNDRIESLERELLMSEENLENAILQTETSNEEVERVKEQKEALEMELKCLRKKLKELEEELQINREKMVELEATIANVTKTLENREMEHIQFMDNSNKQQDLLHMELEELIAQKALSDQKYETAVADCAELSSKVEQQKEQLLQELQKAQTTSNDLEISLQKVTLEQEECKLLLVEKTRQLVVLEGQIKDVEQKEEKYSSQVSQFEMECENLRNSNKSLQIALEESEGKVRNILEENETLQSTITGLKASCGDLEALMESTKLENQTLQSKVAGKELKELEEELQINREKMVELEATIANVTKALENRQMEHIQFMDNSNKQKDLLHVELEELLAQKALSDQKYETAVADYAELSSKVEQQKEQLLQELEKAQTTSNNLEMSLQKVTLEQEECKLLLDEKTRQLVALESQIKDVEQKEETYSSQVSQFEVECENLRNSNKSLQIALEESEGKVWKILEENETLQSTITGLKASCGDLEALMESTKLENQTLQSKVAGKQFKELEEELQINREKMVELEATIANITKTLENREMEHIQFMDNSNKQQDLLHMELEELLAQKGLSDQKYETAVANYVKLSSKVEQQKEQLLQELEKAQMTSNDLEMSLQKVTLEQEEYKLLLVEKTRQLVALEGQIKDVEQKEEKYSSQVSQFEVECENLRNSNKSLQIALEESEGKVWKILEENETVQSTITGLKVSCGDLEALMESTKLENQTLQSKVAGKEFKELEEELQINREKMFELEATIANITKTLENREMEHIQFMDNFNKQQNLLHVELEELLAQKALSDQKYETAVADCAELSSKVEQQKEQLLQELEKAQMTSNDLEISLQKVTLEQEECKLLLDEKTRQLVALEGQIKNSEQMEETYSSQVSQFEVECENLRNSNKSLQIALEESEGKVRNILEENETLQSTITGLKASCGDLEALMESTKLENQTLQSKVAELEENCCGLQNKLQEADLHVKNIQEQNCCEREGLDEELQAIRGQQEDSRAQLLTATTEAAEMKASVASLHKELESQAQRHKDDVTEHETRLLQAESRHRSLVDEMRKQEKATSLESHLSACEQEIDRLRAVNGKLNESLCEAQGRLEEVRALQIKFDELKKKNAKTCSDRRHWMNLCKELEGEKGQLQKRLLEQEEALQDPTRKRDGTDMNSSDNESSEIEELKQCLEEKTLEADETIEKYCNLMIKTHKLEDSNETLQKQVDLLRSRLKELEAKKEVLESPSSEGAEMEAKNRRKNRRSTQGKQTGKRRRESENTGHNPSTPQVVTKRVKKTGDQKEEEQFEPEGLPEVVKKGFSDIPSGKQSPFVLRRAAVPIRRSPRLSSQTNSPSVLNTHIDNLENIPDLKSLTPGGSKSHLTKATEDDSAPMDTLSPRSASVLMKSRASNNLCGGEPESARAGAKVSHDETEEEEGTCHVQ